MNRAFLGAYNKGRLAFRDSEDAAVCPYPDKRCGKYDHIVTFSRAFQTYWREGFEDEKAGLPMRYPIDKGKEARCQSQHPPRLENAGKPKVVKPR
ncbi:MAG: hypothetical protein KAT00_01500 [Planctomycetes bacterium]|nr:hypothetical protein [Planctomycetota bacterium]